MFCCASSEPSSSLASEVCLQEGEQKFLVRANKKIEGLHAPVLKYIGFTSWARIRNEGGKNWGGEGGKGGNKLHPPGENEPDPLDIGDIIDNALQKCDNNDCGIAPKYWGEAVGWDKKWPAILDMVGYGGTDKSTRYCPNVAKIREWDSKGLPKDMRPSTLCDYLLEYACYVHFERRIQVVVEEGGAPLFIDLGYGRLDTYKKMILQIKKDVIDKLKEDGKCPEYFQDKHFTEAEWTFKVTTENGEQERLFKTPETTLGEAMEKFPDVFKKEGTNKILFARDTSQPGVGFKNESINVTIAYKNDKKGKFYKITICEGATVAQVKDKVIDKLEFKKAGEKDKVLENGVFFKVDTAAGETPDVFRTQLTVLGWPNRGATDEFTSGGTYMLDATTKPPKEE